MLGQRTDQPPCRPPNGTGLLTCQHSWVEACCCFQAGHGVSTNRCDRRAGSVDKNSVIPGSTTSLIIRGSDPGSRVRSLLRDGLSATRRLNNYECPRHSLGRRCTTWVKVNPLGFPANPCPSGRHTATLWGWSHRILPATGPTAAMPRHALQNRLPLPDRPMPRVDRYG